MLVMPFAGHSPSGRPCHGEGAPVPGPGDGLVLGVTVGLGVSVGVSDGDGLGGVDVDGDGDGVGDVELGDGDGEGLTEMVVCAGTTRSGVCTGCRLGASMRTSAAMIMAATAIALPAAAPAAKARLSRRYSVRRRSRSHVGSDARCAAQLLNGAAHIPRVGKKRSPASSGPLG